MKTDICGKSMYAADSNIITVIILTKDKSITTIVVKIK